MTGKISVLLLLLVRLLLHRYPMATAANTSSSSYLQSLVELDDLLVSSKDTQLSRQGRVDNVVVSAQQQNTTSAHDAQESVTPICRLDYMVSLSAMNPKTKRRLPINLSFNVEGAAAIALAVQHLNTGDGSVVPQLEGLNERCPLKFQFQAFDSFFNQKLAVEQIIDMTTDKAQQPHSHELSTCVVLGSIMSRITMSTALITSMRGYLQMGYSTATELEDRDLFPLAARIVPTLMQNTVVMIRYLREQLNVKHLAVLHTDTRESQSYSVALQQAAVTYAPDLELFSIDIPDHVTPDIIQQAVTKLKNTQFTYFIAAVKGQHIPTLFNEAYQQGISGTGKHTWFLPVGEAYFKSAIVARDSPLARSFPGAYLVRLDGSWQQPIYDRLAAGLQQLGTSQADKEYILSKMPLYRDVLARNGTNIFAPIINNPTFLQRPPQGAVTWAYDSAVAIGLAACNATTTTSINNHTMSSLDGKDHFQSLTQTAFSGSTGNVSFETTTGTRQNPRYQVSNVQLDTDDRSNDTHVAFKVVTTSLFVDDEFFALSQPPIFNDGTTNIPLDLPPAELDQNFLSRGLQAVGWTMCAIIVVMALSASAWVLVHTNERVVLAAQPIFLHMLAVGIAICATAIIPLSIDEGTAQSWEGCNVACRSFPWLLSIGFSLSFSALWAKTHRVNRILQSPSFRRIKVSAVDVVKPMTVFLGANVLVLSLWTGLSPLHCDTKVLATDAFGRETETISFCSSEEHGQEFLIALGAVNLGPLVFALWEAYKARNISTEYSETDYILKALVVMCLVCFMGIPVLVIAHDNPSAYFFVLSAIIFVVCLAISLLIFGPKIIAYYNIRLSKPGNVPLRFLRSQRPFEFSSEMRSTDSGRVGSTSRMVNGGTGSGDGSSDLSMGLKIISHPKTQENLREDNKILRLQNEELKRSLASFFEENHDNDSKPEECNNESDNGRSPTVKAGPEEALAKLPKESKELTKRRVRIAEAGEEKQQTDTLQLEVRFSENDEGKIEP